MTYPRHMPFMYNVYSNTSDMEYLYTLVLIGIWDMAPYRHEWWGRDDLKDKWVFQPDIDLTEEQHRFDSEAEALEFIREWYRALK